MIVMPQSTPVARKTDMIFNEKDEEDEVYEYTTSPSNTTDDRQDDDRRNI
jgi:hypothetical protein